MYISIYIDIDIYIYRYLSIYLSICLCLSGLTRLPTATLQHDTRVLLLTRKYGQTCQSSTLLEAHSSPPVSSLLPLSVTCDASSATHAQEG